MRVGFRDKPPEGHRAKACRAMGQPTRPIATGPRRVWCRDMSFLPVQVTGRWFLPYLILGLHSRKIIGAEVHDTDRSDHVLHLVRHTVLVEGICRQTSSQWLHDRSDNYPDACRVRP